MKGNAATLNLATVVQNQGTQAENCRVRWQILDASGKVVGTADSMPQSVAAEGSAEFHSQRFDRESIAVVAGNSEPVFGGRNRRIGRQGARRRARQLRRTRHQWDADKGFFLNGKSVKIKGTCNHQDHAGVGAALPDRMQYYRLAVLKEMGGNAVRTSHNMPTPEWVEACDRMGMMMMCETRLMSSNPEGMAQLETMIKRYRNSPSIILWSMGNEEWTMMPQPQGARVIDRHDRAHARTRSDAAVHGGGEYRRSTTHFPEELDVMGFNYNLKEHRRISREASQAAERGIGNGEHGFDARHLFDRQVAELGERL